METSTLVIASVPIYLYIPLCIEDTAVGKENSETLANYLPQAVKDPYSGKLQWFHQHSFWTLYLILSQPR